MEKNKSPHINVDSTFLFIFDKKEKRITEKERTYSKGNVNYWLNTEIENQPLHIVTNKLKKVSIFKSCIHELLKLVKI